MKKIFFFILVSILIPNITFAAWWNPVSWFQKFFSKKEPEVRIVEKIVYVPVPTLELDPASSTIRSISSTTTSDVSEFINKKIVPDKKTITTSPNIPLTTKTDDKKIVDYSVTYKLVLGDYLAFLDILKMEMISLDVQAKDNNVQKLYLNNLAKIRDVTEKDLQSLSSTPESRYSESVVYQNKISEYKNWYEKEKLSNSRLVVIQYFKDYREYLTVPENHIKAANLLDLFDRTFSTKYAQTFRNTKTYAETVEFTDSFLLDMGY
jgi:hypothetical protein